MDEATCGCGTRGMALQVRDGVSVFTGWEGVSILRKWWGLFHHWEPQELAVVIWDWEQDDREWEEESWWENHKDLSHMFQPTKDCSRGKHFVLSKQNHWEEVAEKVWCLWTLSYLMVFYVALSSLVDLLLSLRPLFSSVPCVSRYTGQIRSANTLVLFLRCCGSVSLSALIYLSSLTGWT